MSAPLSADGVAAPPRANGELVFSEPWESRAFGLAVALYEDGAFEWPQFQAALIARIGSWEAAPTGDWRYYDHWLAALEDVLVDTGAMPGGEVLSLAERLALRPAGHDHAHPHPH